MSILTKELPEYIVIDGKEHRIKTDFKIWLEFSEIVGSGELTPERIVKIFKIVFFELPPNMLKALKVVFEFYSHSEKTEKKEKAEKKVFDFEYDADIIFASFMQQYKLDLTEVELHWWKFLNLFQNLSEDTKFMEVVKYRSIRLSDIKDKKQKKFYAKMKKLYSLPDNRNQAQKENDLISAFEKIF